MRLPRRWARFLKTYGAQSTLLLSQSGYPLTERQEDLTPVQRYFLIKGIAAINSEDLEVFREENPNKSITPAPKGSNLRERVRIKREKP